MFKWWNNLFGGGYEKLVEKQAEMDAYEEEIKQEPAVVKTKDVSEPVISFINCIKENPKRFKCKVKTETGSIGYTTTYNLIDTVTKQEWSVYVSSYTFNSYRLCKLVTEQHPCTHYHGWPEFLTEDEKEYLYDNINQILEERYERKRLIKKQRKEREANKERQRLMSIYCKEG